MRIPINEKTWEEIKAGVKEYGNAYPAFGKAFAEAYLREAFEESRTKDPEASESTTKDKS